MSEALSALGFASHNCLLRDTLTPPPPHFAPTQYEELLNLLEDDLEGALKEDEAVQEALAQPDTPDLQYEVPELSVRVVDRWVPEVSMHARYMVGLVF